MEIDEGGRYLIRDYHLRPPFASFLPGIAGLTGIPVWVFLVNRLFVTLIIACQTMLIGKVGCTHLC